VRVVAAELAVDLLQDVVQGFRELCGVVASDARQRG
jgi:hypothetical protein